MGQFDSPTEATLARFKSETLSSSPAGSVVDKVVNLGGILLEAIGFTGASGGTKFFSVLKNLATKKDETNLIYFGDALVDDIRRLYRLCEELRQQFDERINSPEFSAVVANATLHITRTNVENRLKRLAHLIANGVKQDDLEPESLDDMMRAAVELNEADVILLGNLYKWQNHILNEKGMNPTKWYGDIQSAHQNLVKSGALNSHEHLNYRSSYLRLERSGLIQQITSINNLDGVGYELYALLMGGKKFYERLQEIAVPK
jgi:hypothetical protein